MEWRQCQAQLGGNPKLGRLWRSSEFMELASRKSSSEAADVWESGPVSSQESCSAGELSALGLCGRC